MPLKGRDVLLVGSVPFDTVEDVLETCAGLLGGRAFALPDGETGHRRNWVQALPHLTYSRNPDLDPIRVVAPEDVKCPPNHDPELMKATRSTYRLKPGVTRTTLDLPYASEAIRSYAIYRRLRADGRIASGIPFQVSLPCTVDATVGFFPDPADHPVVMRAYERAIQADIARMLAHIPAEELVIQWDYCSELLDIMGARRDYLDGRSGIEALTEEDRIRKYTAPGYLAPMTETIPEPVPIGYHLCYGTWGGWPMTEVDDLALCVRLANDLCAGTPRRVDFFHLPTMPDADEDFFRPLQNLDIGDARVFLGIELGDGVDEMLRRAEAARKFLPDFGVAHYCGYGRDEPARVRELLADTATGADRLAG